jgi:hypothetical protein
MLGDPRLLKFARLGCLIIFDSLIRFQNSASEMRIVMGHLRSLAAAGATVGRAPPSRQIGVQQLSRLD